MTGIILAGGKSTRIGKDKALLKISREYLIKLVLERLKSVFKNVLVVTGDPSRYKFLKVPVIKDAVYQKGPLGGIYTGLLYSKDDYNFICGCDMPFLNSNLLNFILTND